MRKPTGKVHKILFQLPLYLYKLAFKRIPSIAKAEKRWAMFQILLSLVFFFVAVAVGLLTIDTATISEGFMIAALVLFVLGLLALVYAFGIGLYWFRAKRPMGEMEEEGQLHKDIQALVGEIRALVKEMREGRGKDGK
jgi:hypothetical protein